MPALRLLARGPSWSREVRRHPSLEERRVFVLDGRDDQRPVEVAVHALAARLGDEQAPVAGGALAPATVFRAVGLVGGADGIVGAQEVHLHRAAQVADDVGALVGWFMPGLLGSYGAAAALVAGSVVSMALTVWQLGQFGAR